MKYSFKVDESVEKLLPDTVENMRGRLYATKYFTSFVDDDDFENKQFDRYVSKVEKFLKEQLSIITPDRVQPDDVQWYLWSILYIYYKDFEQNDESDIKGTLCMMIYDYHIKPEIKTYDAMMKRAEEESNLLKNTDGIKSNVLDVDKAKKMPSLIAKELRAVCKEFIRSRSSNNMLIDRSTYFSTLPNTTEDAIYIIRETLNRTVIDIERLVRSVLFESFVETRKNDIVSSLMKQLEEVKSENDDKDSQIKELQMKLKVLQEKYDSAINYNFDVLEEAKDYSNAVCRENQKLKTKYNALLRRYKSLTGNLNTVPDAAGELFDDIIPELDTTKRYLFILGREVTYQSRIAEVFPNALFATKVVNISKMDVDSVVIVTSCIDHDVYYGMKSQCKSQNIPFVHCEHSNIELIKQLLQNELY